MEKKTTLPDNIEIKLLLDWGTKEIHKSIYCAVMNALESIGKHINIKDLDGLTIASDYAYGLSSVNRGSDEFAPLTYTKNDGLEGLAKAVLVFRDNSLKSHLVFSDRFLTQQKGDIEYHNEIMTYTIAHECAHVDIHSFIDVKIPNFLCVHRCESYEESILMDFSLGVIMEYYACRKSVFWGEKYCSDMLYTNVICSLEDVVKKIKKIISEYRLHADIERLVQEIYAKIYFPMECVARLAGHLDGLGGSYEISTYIDDSPEKIFFSEHIQYMHAYLRTIWDSPDSWVDTSVFTPLNKICKQLFYEAGLQFTPLADGRSLVSVP